MPKISNQTLILCISAVATELKQMDTLISDGVAEPEDYEILQDWTEAAEELKETYLALSKSVLNLPPYDDIVR